jgi:hypothetical protein
MGTLGILIEEKDVVVVVWVLGMQSCGLPITLFQLKLKVAKLTQTQPAHLQDGVLENSWWH